MNTYDFDKTIFYPDSSATFFRYCLRRYPFAVIKTLPYSLWLTIRYAFGTLETKRLKQQLFSFLADIPDVDGTVTDFWRANRFRIGQWYLDQKQSDDVIISASPEFLLRPLCEELGVHLIGTQMDKHSGVISGNNCHDVEKVSRFQAQFPVVRPHAFYSDSLSDSPMAALSCQADLVKKHQILPWPNQK